MSQLQEHWLELTILIPLAGAAVVSRAPDAERARRRSLGFAAATLATALLAWATYQQAAVPLAGRRWLALDALSAPLLPLVATIYLLTLAVTLRTKAGRFSFAWTLVAECIALATFACHEPAGIIALMALGTFPPYRELRARRQPTTVFVVHMLVASVALAAGWWLGAAGHSPGSATAATALVLLGVLVRCGVAPFHCWMTDLFERATFGTALTFVLPLPGAYAALRLLAPGSPQWALQIVGVGGVVTAVYAAGMALVQRDVRRFYCYVVLSHASLVLAGLQSLNQVGITGGLCVWLSAALALAGFGLTLRAIEGRAGRLSLAEYHGLYDHMPTLGAFFLLTGMASVGFPGTFGFIGAEMLVDGAVSSHYVVGLAIVAASALNGIAVLQAYFKLFTGTLRLSTVSLALRPRERFAVLVLAILIFGGGIFPQPGASSRSEAARELLELRREGRIVASRRDRAVGDLRMR